MLTQSRLKDVVHYDAESGIFTNKIGRQSAPKGIRSGCVSALHGYEIIGIDNKKYKGHQLAWLYIYGVWPSNVIDHINGNPADNRIKNLRDVTRFTNQQNYRKPNKNNKSGFLGIVKMGKKWQAQIYCVRKICLGTYETKEEASAAYIAAKRILHDGCTL